MFLPVLFAFFSVRKVKRKKKKREGKGNRKHKREIILKWIILIKSPVRALIQECPFTNSAVGKGPWRTI